MKALSLMTALMFVAGVASAQTPTTMAAPATGTTGAATTESTMAAPAAGHDAHGTATKTKKETKKKTKQ